MAHGCLNTDTMGGKSSQANFSMQFFLEYIYKSSEKDLSLSYSVLDAS